MRGEGRSGGVAIPYSDIFYLDDEPDTEAEPRPSKMTEAVLDVKEKVVSAIHHVKALFKSIKPSKTRSKPQKTAATKRLLFGEVDTDSASSIMSSDERGRGGTVSSSRRASYLDVVAVEKECWIKGLLWFYGVRSTFASSYSSGAGEYQVQYLDEKKSFGIDERGGLLEVSKVQ